MDPFSKDTKYTPNPDAIPTPPHDWLTSGFFKDSSKGFSSRFPAPQSAVNDAFDSFSSFLSASPGDRNNNNNNHHHHNNGSIFGSMSSNPIASIPLYRSNTIASPMKCSSDTDWDLAPKGPVAPRDPFYSLQTQQSTSSSSPLSPPPGATFPPSAFSLNEIDVAPPFEFNAYGSAIGPRAALAAKYSSLFPTPSGGNGGRENGLFGKEDSAKQEFLEQQFLQQHQSLQQQRLKDSLKERVPWPRDLASRAPGPSKDLANAGGSGNESSSLSRSLTDISSAGNDRPAAGNGSIAPASKKWASVVSCNMPPSNGPAPTLVSSSTQPQPPSGPRTQGKALKRTVQQDLSEEIKKLEELDIYMPKTVWLMIRYGHKKFNKPDIQKFIASVAKAYGLLLEEFYLYYQEFKKTDHIVVQMSSKNYEKLNGLCSVTDPKIKIGSQEYCFRRISPIIQCFLCFSFDHYNSNCNLVCKRCEQCSESFKPGHSCSILSCCNCKALKKRYDHSPKSLTCPIVFDKCQQIAERIIYLD